MEMLCFFLMRGQYSHTYNMLDNSLFIPTNQSASGWMYYGCVNIYYREETDWSVYITMSIISTAPVCLQTVKILQKNSPNVVTGSENFEIDVLLVYNRSLLFYNPTCRVFDIATDRFWTLPFLQPMKQRFCFTSQNKLITGRYSTETDWLSGCW